MASFLLQGSTDAVAELSPLVGVRAACAAVGRSRAGKPVAAARAQPRALSAAERAHVRQVLNSLRFVDVAPATVWATLLDEGAVFVQPVHHVSDLA